MSRFVLVGAAVGLLIVAALELSRPHEILPDPGARIVPAPPTLDGFSCAYPPTLEIATESDILGLTTIVLADQYFECCRSGALSQAVGLFAASMITTTIDPWGHEYSVRCGKRLFKVISAGPDGLFDTADDISHQAPRGDTRRDRSCLATGPFTPADDENFSSMDDD